MTNKLIFQQSPNGAEAEKPIAKLAKTTNSETLVSHKDIDSSFFRMLEDKGIYLNKNQIEACLHVDGPLLTLAGAGSGKTSVLVARTAYLIMKGIHPKNILLMTFTKKAATEMKERIRKLTNTNAASQLTAGTFHSVFLRLIRHKGYTQDIISEKNKQITMKILLKEHGLHDSYKPESLLATLSYLKNNIIRIHDLPEANDNQKEMKKLLLRYEDWKTNHNKIDFDDILLEAYYLLKNDKNLLLSMQKRFTYIQIDEFQDTNPLQYKLIRMIAEPENNLMVVGDEKQCIYSFNAADHSIILDFDKEYPNCRTVTLDTNYRSTGAIVGLGNEIIKNNQTTKSGDLVVVKESGTLPHFMRPVTTADEAKAVVNEINKLVESGSYEYEDITILHRTLANSRSIFEQLINDNVPFITHHTGEMFYETAIVKPVLDYLRLSLNSQDIRSLESILPSLYLNKEKAITHVTDQEIFYPKDELFLHLFDLPYLKPFQLDKLKKTQQMIRRLKSEKPVDAVKKIRANYDNFVEATDKSNSLHKEMIKEVLDELEESAKIHSSVEAYIKYVDEIIYEHKQMETQKYDNDVNAVSLMTIHKSKGLEFPVVFIIGASEEILPHKTSLHADKMDDVFVTSKGKQKVADALEEERRLAYVAITRCKELLYISSPQKFRGNDIEISRFLLEAYHLEKKDDIWECSKSTCKGWMKVSQANAQDKKRVCPFCHSPMKKATKAIYN